MIDWRFNEQVQQPAPQPRNDQPLPYIPKLTVETIDNHVYFYADVDTDRCLALIRTIREIDIRLRNEYVSRMLLPDHPPTPIWLHVHSPGGSLFAAFSTANQLQQIKTPIYSIVEGYAASAATMISMSCQKRFILPDAYMMIHQLSSIYWGKYEELKDEMHLLNMLMESLKGFYGKHSKLTGDEIQDILKRDSWFNAAECMEKGFVDDILKQ